MKLLRKLMCLCGWHRYSHREYIDNIVKAYTKIQFSEYGYDDLERRFQRIVNFMSNSSNLPKKVCKFCGRRL